MEGEMNMWRFLDDLAEIRSENEVYFDKHQSGQFSDKMYFHYMQTAWMKTVEKFLNTYGPCLVPYDIRWGVNDVQEGLGMSKTKWPERKKISDDGKTTIVDTW